MSAPTEAEIRAAIDAAIDSSDIDIGHWVYEIIRPLLFVENARRGPAYDPAEQLWDDLSPSQARRLEELREAIYVDGVLQGLGLGLVARIREAAVRAALTFASEYPDASRPVRP